MRFKTLLKVTGGVLLACCLLLGVFYMVQDRVIFQGRTPTPEELARVSSNFPRAKEVTVEAPDGTGLHGWYLPGEGPGKQPLVIYYGGNASLAVDILPHARHLAGKALLAMDYRGYGLSEGKPREELLYEDALLVFDHFAGREDIDGERIFLMGFSLGTTVATYVAANRPVRAVVLAAPFESVSAIIQQWLPLLPANLFIRNPMDASVSAPDTRAPLLALVADRDRVVPNRRSRSLARLWGGESTVQVIEGRGHNDMHRDPLFWESISVFWDGI